MNLLLLILLSSCAGVFGADAGDVKMMSVMEGDSVTLNTCVNDIQKDSRIMWTYEADSVLAKISKDQQISIHDDVLDQRFKDRLKLDDQTGSLTITNIRSKHSGLYTLQIISISAGTSKKTFNVTVIGVFDPESDKLRSVSKMEGESVTLYTNATLKRDDLILWKFRQPTKDCVYDIIPCQSDVPAIARLDRETGHTSVDDGEGQIFSGHLNLNQQTGDLIISHIRRQHTGFYLLQISRNTEMLCRRFNITVSINESSQRSHWNITGPVLLVLLVLLGLSFIIYQLYSKQCRSDHQPVSEQNSSLMTNLEGGQTTQNTETQQISYSH